MIRINNQTFNSSSSISIVNGKVIVDGKEVDLDKCLTVRIEGDVREFKADYVKSIEVAGSVVALSTMSGDVSCQDITGSVSTMSGDVNARDIKGPVSTMSGDIST